jgi:hypothetical protein
VLDDRGLVINWLVKVVLAFTVVGLLLFEVGAVIVARASADSTAGKAAEDAGFRYRDTRDIGVATEAARTRAENEGAEFISYGVNAQGDTNSVTVRKTAKTLFIQRIEPLKKYRVATATESTSIPQ